MYEKSVSSIEQKVTKNFTEKLQCFLLYLCEVWQKLQRGPQFQNITRRKKEKHFAFAKMHKTVSLEILVV